MGSTAILQTQNAVVSGANQYYTAGLNAPSVLRKGNSEARKIHDLVQLLDIEAKKRVEEMRNMANLKAQFLLEELRAKCQALPKPIMQLTVAQYSEYGGDPTAYFRIVAQRQLEGILNAPSATLQNRAKRAAEDLAAASTKRTEPPSASRTATRPRTRKQTLVAAQPPAEPGTARRMTRSQARTGVPDPADPYATPVIARAPRPYNAPDPDKTPFIDPRLPNARPGEGGTLVPGGTLGRISIVPNMSNSAHLIAVPLADGNIVSLDPQQSPSSLPGHIRSEAMEQIKALHDQLATFIDRMHKK